MKEPICINCIKISNRLVMPPMATEKAGSGGKVSDGLYAYYDEKTRGWHIGLVITEHSYVSPEGKASRGQLSMADDSVIAVFCRLTDTIHKNGSKVLAQLNHAGGTADSGINGLPSVAPSPVAMPKRNTLPQREMDSSDLELVVASFVNAAVRAKKSGFDGVEIYSAHGYLLNQFFSPLTNRRDDIYSGKTLAGRIRLHTEIISEVRKAVGKDYLVALRLGACDYMDGGSTVDESVSAAEKFEVAGIDLLDISGGFCGYTNPKNKEQGYFSEITEAVKKRVSVPVILTGGITDPFAAEALLKEGKADLIGVGRAILRDSHWAETAVG